MPGWRRVVHAATISAAGCIRRGGRAPSVSPWRVRAVRERAAQRPTRPRGAAFSRGVTDDNNVWIGSQPRSGPR